MKNSDIGTGSWRFSINGSRNNWIFSSMSLGVISTLCLSELCENRAGKAPEDPQGENWGTFCFLLTRARHHSLVWIPWRFPCCCEPVLPNLPPHSSNVNRKSPDTRSECLEKLIYFHLSLWAELGLNSSEVIAENPQPGSMCAPASCLV